MKQGTKEYRQAHIKEMQSWKLDKKINHSLKRIREFYEAQEGKVYIAFSGGKDSTVLLHLVRSIYPDVVAVFSNTTNEYVEILEFVKQTPNVITINPKITFNETVKEFGFPLVSKKVSRSIFDLKNPTSKNVATRNLYLTGIKRDGTKSKNFKLAKKWHFLIEENFNITNKCCDILKKEPMSRFEKESGLYPIIGTQTSESAQRKQSWIETGCNTITGNDIKSNPLSIWNEENIWEYIYRFNIPYSSIYDDVIDKNTGQVLIEGEKRTGCAYCAFGAHLEKSDLEHKNRFERLALRKPKQFKKMMLLENNGVTFREALTKIGVRT